jgi:hypothetical protein
MMTKVTFLCLHQVLTRNTLEDTLLTLILSPALLLLVKGTFLLSMPFGKVLG